MGFPGVSLAKNMPLSAGDEGSIPGLEDEGSIPGLEDPLKEEMATHSMATSLGNPMDRGGLQFMG